MGRRRERGRKGIGCPEGRGGEGGGLADARQPAGPERSAEAPRKEGHSSCRTDSVGGELTQHVEETDNVTRPSSFILREYNPFPLSTLGVVKSIIANAGRTRVEHGEGEGWGSGYGERRGEEGMVISVV